MGFNPVYFIYRWVNRRAIKETGNAKRQRNVTARELDRVRREAGRNARSYLEGQGFVVIEGGEYESLGRQLQEVQQENRLLRGQLESAVPKKTYEALERKLSQATGNIRGLQQQLAVMVPRSELDRQRSRAGQAEDERGILRGQLRFMVPQEDYHTIQRALEGKTATIESLQRELAEAGRRLQDMVPRSELEDAQRQKTAAERQLSATTQESRSRGVIIADVFARLRTWHKNLPYGEPPEGSIVAICNRDAYSIVASAQLLRMQRIGVGYGFPETWYEWLPKLKINGKNATRGVVIIGLYPDSDETIKQLNFLYENGVSVTLVTDRQDIQLPSFVSVQSASSLASALHTYTSAGGVSDKIIARLASLGDACTTGSTEEAAYLRDSLYDPTNTGFIRGVVSCTVTDLLS